MRRAVFYVSTGEIYSARRSGKAADRNRRGYVRSLGSSAAPQNLLGDQSGG
jgi:hypothetical protein